MPLQKICVPASLCLLTAWLTASATFAQDLRALEGTTVTLKIDMPASSNGVDIRPASGAPLDFRKVADGIHQYGVGVHAGESIMITKVILKSKNIEVHLGGGGFGTFSDRLAVAAATPTIPYEGETRREKDLKEELKYTDDSWKRSRIRRELDYLQRDRERDYARNAAINAQTQQMVNANVREQRAGSGSRFNIRYDGGMPPSAGTQAGIMEALSKYVDFGGASEPAPAATAAPNGTQSFSQSPAAPALRKGLTVIQVEQMLGPAAKVSQKNEGSLEISVREYTADGQQITTQFAGGVLIDYKITPR